MRRFRRHFLTNLSASIFGVAVFEIAYALLLAERLSRFWFFRVHGPTLVIGAIVSVGAIVSYVEFHGFGSQEGVIRGGHPRRKVALTFDDGPHPIYTSQLLDILQEKEVKASFFLVGKHVLKYPEIAKRIEQEGHDIGNHSYTHRDLLTAGRRTVLSEVGKAEEAIFNVTGVRTKLFRPPRGALGPAGLRLVLESGYRIVLWTVSSADWSGLPSKAIATRVVHYTRPGDIVLFHDSGALVRSEGRSRGNTVKALPEVIDRLRAKGFELVPLSEMLSEMGRNDSLPPEDLEATFRPMELQ